MPSRWVTPEAQVELALRELSHESGPMFVGATAILTVMNVLTWTLGQFHPLDVVYLGAWAIATALTLRRLVPVRGIPWLWGGLAASIVGALWVEMGTRDDLGAFGYVLVICAVFPPLTLFWRPVLVMGAVVLAFTVVTVIVEADSSMWSTVDRSDAVLQTFAALLGGCVALYFRRRSLASTADTTTQLQTRALTDGLTGVLNRSGIDEMGPRLIERAHGPVFALFVDINGLKAVNDTRGHDVGDEVIRSVALALRNVTRAGDLIGRWGGDEFVVVGIGESPDPEIIEKRMQKVLAQLGITRMWWQGVTVGGVSGAQDYESLVAAADEAMYARRATKRGATPPA